jgi:pimeloyl-ACP methyl ester carboxylesterase
MKRLRSLGINLRGARNTRVRQAVIRDAVTMKQFRRGELVFDVTDSGPADGSVVILLHGAPQLNAAWDAVIPLLAARGYRCLAPNQRGYTPGARPERRRDYRMSELVDDVGALIDASGAEKVHLVGHDAGAGVGWIFAANHADRLLTFTALSTPHPTAFKQAILTSRQGNTSWYVYFYQLPRIPEWYFLGWRDAQHCHATFRRADRPLRWQTEMLARWPNPER